jgi:hypothetical protein
MLAEIRPDGVVEDVRLQRIDRALQGMNLYRRRPPRRDGVHHQRQRRDVVQVRMREQHVVDAGHLVEREVAHTGAGVDQHVVVEQKRRGPAVLGDGSRAAQYTYFHEVFRLALSVGARALGAFILFGLKIGCAVPLRIKRQQPHGGYTLRIQPVKELFAISPLQIEQLHVALVPVLGAVGLQGHAPGFQLVGTVLVDPVRRRQGPKNGHSLIFALHADFVQFLPRKSPASLRVDSLTTMSTP